MFPHIHFPGPQFYLDSAQPDYTDRSLKDGGEAIVLRSRLANAQTNITLVYTATFSLIPNGTQINQRKGNCSNTGFSLGKHDKELEVSTERGRHHSFGCARTNEEEIGIAHPSLISLAQILVDNGKC